MFKLSYSMNGLTNLDFYRAALEAEKAGFDGVELSFQYKQFDPFSLSEDDLVKIRDFFRGSRVKPICISTATTFFLSEIPHEPSIISLSQEKRQQRIDLIKKGISMAKTIGIPIVSFQSGYLRQEHVDNPSIDPRKLLIDGIKSCLENIGDVTLVIEPEPGMYIETIDDAISLIKDVDSPNFSLHLDICHTYCTEDNYVNAISKAIPHISYMHLADIKEGYNLRLQSLSAEQKLSVKLNLERYGYLLHMEDKNCFYFIDSEHCIYFYQNDLKSVEKAEAVNFVSPYHSRVDFVKIDDMNIQSEKSIELEIKAYLGSVGEIGFDIIQKADPILKYLRSKHDECCNPIIQQPVCNTVNGKVHYHEFPGMGEIDFHAVLKALKDNGYNGYVTVELYNHSDVWEKVLPESRKYLLSCMDAENVAETPKEETYGWIPEGLGEVNHRLVKAPYIRLSQYTKGNKGDIVFFYDLRFTQPNKVYMETRVLHSLEHLLLAGFRKYLDGFISVSPMGCQTGFYLITLNSCNVQHITSTFERVMREILVIDEVPYNTDRECGQASHHDLKGAKLLVQKILEQKASWLKVFEN